MRVLTLTKRMIEDGSAYKDWADPQGTGTIGGAYQELLFSFCDEEDPVSLVAMTDDGPVGQVNFLKGLLHLEDSTIPVFWAAGLSVKPDHRNTGAGMLLLAKSRSIKPAVGVGSVSQQAVPLYIKLGWRLFTLPRYVFPVKPSTYFLRKFGVSLVARCIGFVADSISRAYRRTVIYLSDRRARRYRIALANEIALEEEDKFNSYTRRPYRTHRSTQWVNRIMSEGPMQNSRRLFLVYGDDEELAGYFIVTTALRRGVAGGKYGDLRVASIRDWVAFRTSDLTDDDLLLFGLRELLRAECDVAEICVPESESASILRGRGMIRMGEQHFFIRFNSPIENDAPGIDEPENWWFRPGDGDAFLL